MRRHTLIGLGLLVFIVPCVSRGEKDWKGIRPDLTPDQAIKEFGPPLLRRYSRGIDVWIYDSCGEIVFAGGPLLGWTPPVPNPESEARPIERDVTFRPRRRVPSVWQGSGNSQITATSIPTYAPNSGVLWLPK